MEWKEEFLKVDDPSDVDATIFCLIADTAPSNTNNGNSKKNKNIQIYCIEGMPKTFKQMEMIKAALGYGNDESDFKNMVAISKRMAFTFSWMISLGPRGEG